MPGESEKQPPGAKPSEKFSDAATLKSDLRKLMMKVHPEHVRGEHTAEMTSKLTRLLTGLFHEFEQTQLRRWPADVEKNIKSGHESMVSFVRKLGDAPPEISKQVRLPRTPRPFLRALDAYTDGAPWEKVMELLGGRMEPQGGGGANREQLASAKEDIENVDSVDAARDQVRKIFAIFSQDHVRTQVMSQLSRRIEYVLEKRLHECRDLASHLQISLEMKSFLDTDEGRNFRKVAFMDILDNAALNIGKQMLLSANSESQVENVMASIRAHPFTFAHVYEKPFSETRADAIAKIDFLIALRRKRSPAGLDELRKEVEKFEFNSKELESQYKQQILEFIEKKREVYWPKERRESMPQE